MLSVATDADVIAASDSDPERFELIFDRHFEAIHRYLHRRAGKQLADDLASDTFVVAFSRRSSYDQTRPDCRPWLYGIATNLLRHHLRDEQRHLSAHARSAAMDAVDTTDPGTDDRVEASLIARELINAVASLDQGERNVLLMFAWADLSYEEIAYALAVPVGTVRSRLHRVRARLRELLGSRLAIDG